MNFVLARISIVSCRGLFLIYRKAAIFAVILYANIWSWAETAPNSDPRRDPAFAVGDLIVSSYIYDRELKKANQERESRGLDPLGKLELETWSREWADRLCLTNEAIELGYGSHRKVKRAVDILSAYMLVEHPESPFARLLLAESKKTQAKADASVKRRSRQEAKRTISEWESLMADEARIKLNRKLAGELVVELTRNYQGGDKIELENLRIKSGGILFSYFNGSEERRVSVERFAAFYNDAVFKNYPTSLSLLEESVKRMVVGRAKLELALQKGLDLDWRFQEEKENFRRNVIANIFEEEALIPAIDVSRGDIEEAYQTNPEAFLRPKGIYIWRLDFDTFESATLSRRGLTSAIVRGRKDDTFLLDFAIPEEAIQRRVIASSPELPEALGDQLLNRPVGWVSRVYVEDDSFVYFVKGEEEGVEASPLESVESIIRKHIVAEKLGLHKNELLGTLRLKYPLRQWIER